MNALRRGSESQTAWITCKKEHHLSFPFAYLLLGIFPACSLTFHWRYLSNRIDQINKSFPAEFSALQECLDKNDHRMGDCRSAETQLRECWNAKMGYGSK